MEFKKVNLDRQNLSSSYIEKKQDFNHVLKSAKMTKMPTWKSPWFYGAVGLSSVAITALVLSENNFKNETLDTTSTLKEKSTELPKKKTMKMAASFEAMSKTTNPLVTAYRSNVFAPEIEASKNNTVENKLVDLTAESPMDEHLDVIDSPVEPAKETRTVVKTFFSGQPTIAGVASGIIRVESLKNTSIIESNSSFEITSYEVQYYNGKQDITAEIRSNKIPENIKEQIIENNLDEMIFITGIKGIDENGKLRKLPSINLKLSK
jgi:hypothetical protein